MIGRIGLQPRCVGSPVGSDGCRFACDRWEDDRVIVRCRLHRVIGLLCDTPAVSGCSDRFLAGPLQYVDNDALTKELKDKPNLAGKPKLQDKVRTALGEALR